MGRLAEHSITGWLLGAAALLLAAAGARPYAGSWNDGSRLAAVESLIDRGTLAIDDSVFVRPPQRLIDAGPPPYPPDRADLLTFGTMDKLFVGGRYHSDKPPVPTVLMAAAYRGLMAVGLPSPGERPDIFCWTMTVLTSGLGYAVAVGCLWALGGRVGLPPGWRLAWLTAFALSTYAPAYTRHVNMHAVQLGAAAVMCWLLTRSPVGDSAFRIPHSAFLGTLAGFGFTLDYGTGPPLVAAVLGVVWWRTRRAGPVLVYLLAAAPWVLAAVGLNYAIGGGWKPPNMYPAYFEFPGSPFSTANLTGVSHHGPADQLLYAGGMLFGKRGFLNHNLPLLLAAAAGWQVLRRPFTGRAELVGLLGWCVAAWLVYAGLSNNMGGSCCSVRWFVPLLAPGFWLLAVLLRECPEYRPDFAALAGCGAVLAGLMWWQGPWAARMVPLLWPVVGLALVTWAAVRRGVRGQGSGVREGRLAGLPVRLTPVP